MDIVDLVERMDPDLLKSILTKNSSNQEYRNASKIVRLVFKIKLEKLIQLNVRSVFEILENPALLEQSFIHTKLTKFYESNPQTDKSLEEYQFVEDNFDSVIKIQGQFISNVLALKHDLSKKVIRNDFLKGHQRMFAYFETQNIEPNPFIIKSQKGIQTLYKLSPSIGNTDLIPVIAGGQKVNRIDKIALLLEKALFIDSSNKLLALFGRNHLTDFPIWFSKPSHIIFLFYLLEEQKIIPTIVLNNLKSIVSSHFRDHHGEKFKDNSINQAIKRRRESNLTSRAYLSKIKLKDYQQLYYIVTRLQIVDNQLK